MKSLGTHLIVELLDCDAKVIDSLKDVEGILLESAKISGAEIIKSIFHKFTPQGVTGMIVIAESHFSIHTWPEYGYAALDIFTCGKDINSSLALDYLKDKLKVRSLSIVEIKRGTLNIPEQNLKHKPGMG